MAHLSRPKSWQLLAKQEPRPLLLRRLSVSLQLYTPRASSVSIALSWKHGLLVRLVAVLVQPRESRPRITPTRSHNTTRELAS